MSRNARLIRYAGFDPHERRGTTAWKERVARPDRRAQIVDLFDRGFDSAFIARVIHAPEWAIAKEISAAREARHIA